MKEEAGAGGSARAHLITDDYNLGPGTSRSGSSSGSAISLIRVENESVTAQSVSVWLFFLLFFLIFFPFFSFLFPLLLAKEFVISLSPGFMKVLACPEFGV